MCARHTSLIRLVIAVCALALLVVAASAEASVSPPGMPPRGKVLLGMGGTAITPVEFDRLTGAQHKIHLVSINWDEGRQGGWEYALMRRFQEAEAGNYRLMIHIGPARHDGREGRSPGAVARGAADRYLIDMSHQINASGQFVYVRPPAEMNGHWSVWSAYNKNGTRRNADHSTTSYRQAFIRMTLIARGGDVSVINAALRRNRMPVLATSASELPRSGKIAMVFNPQARGAPDEPGNMPAAYYPGAAWVDYVANDLYIQNGRAAWDAQDAMYQRFRAHPFMIAEFAPWGYDDPAFARKMFAWVAAHPRTVALMYFNGTGGETFRLANKPHSLAAYRRAAHAARFQCAGLSATSAAC